MGSFELRDPGFWVPLSAREREAGSLSCTSRACACCEPGPCWEPICWVCQGRSNEAETGREPRVCAGRQPGHCPSASSVSLQAPSAWLPGLPPGAAPGPLATAAMDTASLRGLACLLWLLQILVDREPAALADLLFPVRSLPFSFFHSFICSFR